MPPIVNSTICLWWLKDFHQLQIVRHIAYWKLSGCNYFFVFFFSSKKNILGYIWTESMVCSLNATCQVERGPKTTMFLFSDLLSPFYYKTGTIRCLDLHFSDRTVRLIEIFGNWSSDLIDVIFLGHFILNFIMKPLKLHYPLFS